MNTLRVKSIFFHLFLLLLASGMIRAQDTLVVFPFRHPEILSTDDNGFSSNNKKVYISHLFDGHIYEFDVVKKKLQDKFRIRNEDSNLSSAGALIYDKSSRKIYAATSTSMVRVPKIYVFDPRKPGLPQIELSLDTLGIYSFYHPVSDSKYVYWGCYHTRTNAFPMVIRLNKTDMVVDYLSPSSEMNNLKGNYTRSLCYLKNNIFIATDSGVILVYNTLNQKFSEHSISFTSLGIKNLYHLKTDGKGLWALTSSGESTLFYIENPETGQYKIIPVPPEYNISFSRVCSDERDRYLYGTGFRIRYSGNSEFEYENLKDLSYHYLRNIHGMINFNRKKYIFAENVRIKDDEIDQKEFRWSQLPEAEKPEIFKVNDIRSIRTGAILLTMGSNKKDRLFLSTYLTGYLLSVDMDFNYGVEFLRDDKQVRIMAQSDIIGSFPDESGKVYFGFYDGFMNSAKFMIFDSNERDQKRWTAKGLPIINDRLFARITSSCFDDIGNAYLGTGEKTIGVNTQTAKIFFVDKKQGLNKEDETIQREIDINWPPEISITQPVRILSLLYYNQWLYVIGYSPFKSSIINSFFRINLENAKVEVMNKFDESFASMGGNYLLKDKGSLLVAMGTKIYQYDLENFDINSPHKEVKVGESDDKIRDIEKHFLSYACLDNRIIKIDKNLNISTFSNIGIGDKFISIEIIKDYLIAATRNGLLIKYPLSFDSKN